MLAQLVSVIWNLPPLMYVAMILTIAWYCTSKRHLPDNIPPFPCKPYPLLGHLVMMKSGPVEKFHEWRQSAGDIFSLLLGQRFAVVISNVTLLKEALVKQGDIFSNRPVGFLAKMMKSSDRGILVNAGGPNWKEQRSVSISILRSFGMGTNFLAEKISIEVGAYLNTLSDLKGEPTDVRLVTNASVSNIICAILIGNRFELDDPHFVDLLKVLNEMMVLLGSTSLLISFPWLRFIPGDFFKAKRLVRNGFRVREFCQMFIDEFQKGSEENVNNFIKAYFREKEKRHESNISTYLDERNLVVVLSNLFIAGSETTSTTLLWVILFAIRHPETQEKVYKEIIEVVGNRRLPAMEDRARMNYTNAYIMETQRLGSIGPLSLFHLCIADTQVGGYTIPKGTVVIPNLDEILKDQGTWGDPQVFRPERFLDEDNNLLVPEEFIPFSIGRRYCMGESLAKMELFLFVTGILQRFHIKPEDPSNLPPPTGVFGVTCCPDCPEPFKTRLIERNGIQHD